MSERRIIRIFDTTLRDGEQSPGASMNLAEKMEIAQALVDLGVDIIEAGFPIASPGDFRGGSRNRRQHPRQHDLRPGSLERRRYRSRWEALKAAPNPRIHIFLATSAIHREFKLKMDKEEIIRRAVAAVAAGDQLLRRHRILARGRRPHRARFSLPGGRSGNRRRRHDRQHPRHRRLRHAGSHGRRDSQSDQSRPQYRSRPWSACIATTIWAWPSPIVSPESKPAPGKSNARSTASANGPATARSKKW